MPATKAILIVIDGLTPSVFEAAVGDGRAPALSFLAEHGSYTRAVSTFPSLTPVCLSSLATGAHPDVHHIPHLVWYDRDRKRLVEYGSSFAALRAAGMARSILDAIINMNRLHLSPAAVTMYEAVEDAGLTTAAVNITCYRGRTRHLPTLPGVTIPAYGPRRFFFYNLFESDPTGAPLAVFGRSQGSIDGYAAAVGRWLVTRDGFDLLVYYLPDYDFASHVHGPDGTVEALARSDAAVGALLDAAGGPDEFLERYSVVLCADHGQTHVERSERLQDVYARVPGTLVTASNRAGMVYRLPDCALDTRELAELLDDDEAAEVVLFREGEEAFARRDREEVRIERNGPLFDYPDGGSRAWAALQNPNAGEVLVSAAPGVEFADLAGRHHAGGGSHGSLVAGDSEVPMLTIGLDEPPESIVDVAPALIRHFGIEPPPYTRALTRAA
ncbi:MAG TPA: alkaline phosphatase family protein [Gaiellaceae bacterium]|nr:alkaline phosphatase family protein [Gaiellaceae bacterium]HWJ43823.1 alkaline phosphatase family protein [Gaiellaceae bacterium]